VQERERARFELAEKALREEFEASLSLKRSIMQREEQLMEEQQRERRERLERLQQASARSALSILNSMYMHRYMNTSLCARAYMLYPRVHMCCIFVWVRARTCDILKAQAGRCKVQGGCFFIRCPLEYHVSAISINTGT
jgi:hypothetical protein